VRNGDESEEEEEEDEENEPDDGMRCILCNKSWKLESVNELEADALVVLERNGGGREAMGSGGRLDNKSEDASMLRGCELSERTMDSGRCAGAKGEEVV
jgi:hypothetical protein